MIKVEQSIVINRPVEEVFAFVADQTNAPRWQSGLMEVRRTTAGPPGIGTRHTFVRRFVGRRLEASNEYTAYEPNTMVAFKSISDPMDFAAGYPTTPTEGGTELSGWIEMQPKGFAGLTEPLIAASLRRDVQAALVTLKKLLEEGERPVTSRSLPKRADEVEIGMPESGRRRK